MGSGATTFDLAPGRSSVAAEFTPPTGGRLIGVGGYLHDYGVQMQIADTATDSVLVRLEATGIRPGGCRGSRGTCSIVREPR